MTPLAKDIAKVANLTFLLSRRLRKLALRANEENAINGEVLAKTLKEMEARNF